MSDEGFREIQLNGKQLVFLFMAVTVVSVVIFLCGVLVGRGVVRAQQIGELASAAAEVPAESDACAAAPERCFNGCLERRAPLDAGNPYLSESARRAGASSRNAARSPAADPRASRRPSTCRGDRACGFRRCRRTGRQRLRRAGRGRPRARRGGHDRTPSQHQGLSGLCDLTCRGPAPVPRARGEVQDRREAESIAARLEREEQFKPWITR